MVAGLLSSRFFLYRLAEEIDKRDGDDQSDKKIQSDESALEGIKSSTVDILRKAFNLLDADHSGFIELAVHILTIEYSCIVFLLIAKMLHASKELETLLKSRQNIDHDSVTEIMKRLDQDGDALVI